MLISVFKDEYFDTHTDIYFFILNYPKITIARKN